MALASPRGLPALLFLICQLLLIPSAFPLQSAETTSDSDKKTTVSQGRDTEGVKGVAAYYAKRYEGRETCSGEVYDPEKLTAAHPDLPFGARVRVVNLSNDRQVIVTVNDRCRKRSFNFIDLSRAAAQKLGFFGKGIAKVRIIPLGNDS